MKLKKKNYFFKEAAENSEEDLLEYSEKYNEPEDEEEISLKADVKVG